MADGVGVTKGAFGGSDGVFKDSEEDFRGKNSLPSLRYASLSFSEADF